MKTFQHENNLSYESFITQNFQIYNVTGFAILAIHNIIGILVKPSQPQNLESNTS